MHTYRWAETNLASDSNCLDAKCFSKAFRHDTVPSLLSASFRYFNISSTGSSVFIRLLPSSLPGDSLSSTDRLLVLASGDADISDAVEGDEAALVALVERFRGAKKEEIILC